MKRLYLVVLLLLIGCQHAGIGQDAPVPPDTATAAEGKSDDQLEINREALLKGPSEQIRVKAATVMLSDENPLARRILLDALAQSENSAARAAVCKALSQTGASGKSISNIGDFVQPLGEILAMENSDIAKLAAEATLIFEYEQISETLETIAANASLPPASRLNAIYALKLQPTKGAIFKLMDLLDDPDAQVASAARKALRSLRIPVSDDAEVRRRIRVGLEGKDEQEFLRDMLIRQEAVIRQMQNELDWWKRQYLDALGRICDGIAEDAAKGEFLAKHLSSSEVVVKLWALEKVREDRMATPPKLPADLLGPILIDLISDQNGDVRLKTARLLSLMGELNSAAKLLEQHEVEDDDEVRTEILIALGVACSHALRTSSNGISPEIRKQTLELATEYLFKADPKKAQEGAQVIKRLLEQNELASADVEGHLALLAKRYNQEEGRIDGALRGRLLSTMAGLCAQGSACKVEAAEAFGHLFEEALTDKADLVREAAVDGLVYIGRGTALVRFRKSALVNDPSIGIRKKIVNLAGEVGGKDDLVWLWEKVGSTAESEWAWEAMLKIFERSDIAVLAEWVPKFDSMSPDSGLSDDKRLFVLKMAEQKAVGAGENKVEMLRAIWEELAELYGRVGDYEQKAQYLGMLHDAAPTPEEKEAILPGLLDAYLRARNAVRAAKLVDNCLATKDLDPNSPVVHAIEDYLSDPPQGADHYNVLRELLAKIEAVENRPKWGQLLERWNSLLDRAQEGGGLEEAG
ncbi:MAG: HEAT repeat domain-containing protein [Planctomycetota bacterium]